MLNYVCILFTCHIPHLHFIVVWCYVILCRIIRFPILFENVRACTKCAWICAKTVYGECPWLLLLDSPLLVNWRLCSAVWPPNWNHRFRPDSSGLIPRLRSAVVTAVHNWLIFSLGIDSAVVIGGFVIAEWNRRSSPVLSGLHSAVTFCGYVLRPGRRMKPLIGDFKGQTCLFTCPVLDAYKYHTFSLSE